MSDPATQLIIDALKRIEVKVDVAATKADSAATQAAVLTERVGNAIEKIDDHLDMDALTHARIEKAAKDAHSKALAVEKKHDTLSTKVTMWAAGIAFVFTTLLGFAKDAIASAFNWGQ